FPCCVRLISPRTHSSRRTRGLKPTRLPGVSRAKLIARRMCRELVGGNDELGVALAAHAINGSCSASPNGIGVAARMLGGDGDGSISAARDGAFVIEGIGAAEINDEARVFRATHKDDGGAHFNAESLVG